MRIHATSSSTLKDSISSPAGISVPWYETMVTGLGFSRLVVLTSVSWPINDSPEIRVIVRPDPHINPLEEERYNHVLGRYIEGFQYRS